MFWLFFAMVYLHDALLEEVSIFFRNGGNAKQYGQWKKMASILQEKYKLDVDSEKVRKTWNYLV